MCYVIVFYLIEQFGFDLEIEMYHSSLHKSRCRLGLLLFLEADPIMMQLTGPLLLRE
jgi:hypothetical protein